MNEEELGSPLEQIDVDYNYDIKKADKALNVSYEVYIEKHVGKNKGLTPEEKVENLAKLMVVSGLRANQQPFDLKKIHKYAARMKEQFSLDRLKEDPEKLDQILEDYESVLAFGKQQRKDIFAVEDMAGYQAAMTKLAKNMVSSSGHSIEYRNLVGQVQKAAIMDLEHMSKEERENAIINANILIVDAAKKYMTGKEKVRWGAEGNACFANALDAIAVVNQFAPETEDRTKAILDNVNRIRVGGDDMASDYIDPDFLTNNYGADRAEQAIRDAGGRFKTDMLPSKPKQVLAEEQERPRDRQMGI